MGKTVKLPISNFLLDEPHAHADKLWGPYPSLDAAAAAIPAAMKVASFKFGVLSNGVFSEYIYLEDNGTPQELASLKVQLLLNPASGAVAGKILSLDNNLKPVWVEPSSTAERVSFDNSEEVFDGDVSTTQAAIEALKNLLDALDGDVVKGILVNGSEVNIENGVASITIPDAITSVIANNELVFQTPDGQSVKGKVGITTGADGLLHLTLTDEEGHTYSSPIAGLRVVGNALQYSNDGETWVTVQTFGNLAIKYVQASDPASGDVGDLALVGSMNAYVLKVYVGGSWVSACDFGTLNLTSDGIIMSGENKTLTEKIEEVNLIRNNNADSDLDFADENGAVLARFYGGHFKTKNFDSRDVENLPSVADDDSNADLDFCDEQGNVALRVINGHIRTKNFDSKNLDGDAINLPSYWKSYLNTKITSIKAEEDALGRNGAAFIFFSDVHWADNYKQSPSIIKYILRHTHIKDVICGGDLIVLYGNKAEKVSEMKEFCDAVSDIPCINIIGNHDYNTSDQPAASWDTNRITPQEHYRIAMATSERGVDYDQLGTDDVSVTSDYNYPKESYSKNNGRYPEYFGYSDNRSQKIRYIFLDSTCVHVPVSGNGGYTMQSENLRISDNQLKWMQNRIKELDNTWTVVVFTHISLGKGYTQGDNTALVQIGSQIDAALTDESVDNENNAHVAAVICGHNHRDTHSISSNGKFYFISTRSDARKTTQIPTDRPGDNNIASNGGDTSEQAIDIFFLDTENKTIKAKRVGAGDINGDRTFNYQ